MKPEDALVFALVTKGGGVDGRDPTDKGGKVIAVYGFRPAAEMDGNLPWYDIVPTAVDLTRLVKQARAKLNPFELYALMRKGVCFEAHQSQ